MRAFSAWVGKQDYQRSLWLVLWGLLATGCVSLSKPGDVQTCSSSGTCSDDPSKAPGSDAKKDIGSTLADADRDGARDTVNAQDAVPVQNDAGPDVATPDISPADAVPLPDLAPDKPNGAEAAPEPVGAEPSVGPEPGPEPTARVEPGPEPGKEPGPEPGPEPSPEPPRDSGTAESATTASCANATPLTGGSAVANTINAFCFVTCDSMEWGWGCSSFTEVDRTVRVNGVSVTCGGTLPAKKAGGYYYFEVGPGGHTWDQIHYSGTAATSCPTPTGGFSP